MTIFLTTDNQTIASVEALAARMLDQPDIRAQRLGRGANSRVFLLEDRGNARKYVGKFYFRHPADPRDRLEAEFTGFSFLWAQGITDIPRPVAVNREESCAIYDFVEGDKILPEEITGQDIARAVDFLGRLKDLNKTARSHAIAPASDACFSIKSIIANIEGRLSRLVNLDGQEYAELISFLQDDFKPLFNTLTLWSRQYCVDKGIAFDEELPWEERTLSPSDFGFHNAVRTPGGRIVFFDFEYFGWDDPAKTAVDFLWHPAMSLREPLKNEFVRRMIDIFGKNKRLAERVALVYPLFGLKWCTIFLNEFVPNDFSRRAYAAGDPLDRNRIRKEQLCKARNLCQKLKETYLRFPYADQ